MQILQHAAPGGARSAAIAGMIAIAFFHLLQPSEHTGTPSDTTPFHLVDVQFWIGAPWHLALTVPLDALHWVTFATLTSTTQKSSVHGEVIGLSGRSGNSHFCPVLCLASQVCHLQLHAAAVDAPLALHWQASQFKSATPAHTTTALCASHWRTFFVCTAGSMSLLCAHVGDDTIQLTGRWCSNKMLHHLHIQAEPAMHHPTCLMLAGGTLTLLPKQDVPVA